jgi:hypothetical protein
LDSGYVPDIARSKLNAGPCQLKSIALRLRQFGPRNFPIEAKRGAVVDADGVQSHEYSRPAPPALSASRGLARRLGRLKTLRTDFSREFATFGSVDGQVCC